MDRKSFIKKLTAAAIGIVVAKPIIDALPKTSITSREFQIVFTQDWIRKYPLTPDEVFFKEVMESYPKKFYDTELFTPKPIQYESNTDASTRHSEPTT
jgi:hypothetical protein